VTFRLLARPHVRLFGGAALISLSPVWVTLASVSPTTSGFYRVAFGAAALFLFMLVTRRRLVFARPLMVILVLASVLLAVDLIFWHRAIIYLGPGLATLLGNFQVFFMMLAGLLLLGQKPRVAQVVAAPVALAGLTMIVGLDWDSLSADYRLGLGFGFATAVVYAGYLLTVRAAVSGSADLLPVREFAAVSAITALMLAAAVVAEGESLVIPTLADAGWLLGYGVISHCLGWLLITSSLPFISAAQAGIGLLLQPTLSFVWDVLFFDRPLGLVEVMGALLALVAIYVGGGHSDDNRA
jgi:drug/metabolite transporter (DMT)-like permease